jgi:hypothetical protein
MPIIPITKPSINAIASPASKAATGWVKKSNITAKRTEKFHHAEAILLQLCEHEFVM